MARIEGQRLDIVLQRIQKSSEPSTITELEKATSADPVPIFKDDSFGQSTDSGSSFDQSAETLINDFIMPLISDAAIFQDHTLTSLLETLRDEILPTLSDETEMKELATQVIDDELARHKMIRERRLSAVAG
jgi:hypothetical protein